MNLNFFIAGIKYILFDPTDAWKKINIEHKPVTIIRNSLLLPLIILATLASFTGSLLFTGSNLLPVYSLFTAIRTFLVLYCSVYFTSLLLSEITYPLDLGRDYQTSYVLISFSYVPFLVSSIFSGFFESFLFVNIIGLYGLYIFWAGAEKYLNPPQYKKLPLLIATAFTAIVIYIATNYVLKLILDKFYYALFD
jgi:hypothetical protein